MLHRLARAVGWILCRVGWHDYLASGKDWWDWFKYASVEPPTHRCSRCGRVM